VLFDEDCSHETEHRDVIGDDADDIRAPFDLGVHALAEECRPELRPVRDRESTEGDEIGLGQFELLGDLGELGSQGAGDLGELTVDVLGVGLDADRLDRGGDHLGPRLRDPGQGVARQVLPTALPRSAEEDLLDRLFQAEVLVGDDESHTRTTPARKVRRNAVQKAPSSESPTSQPSTGHDDDGAGDDATPETTLHVGGVAKEVGESNVVEPAAAEALHLPVELGADPADLGLGDPRSHPEGGDEVIDFAGRDPIHVGLDDDGEERPVDGATPFEDLGEERAETQLRDLQLDVAGLRRETPRTVAVAPVLAGFGALVGRGTDLFGRLRLDEGLEDELDALVDEVDVAAGVKRVEECVGVNLLLGHRGYLLVVLFWNTSRFTPVVH
jgi:hypothetical protein